MGGWAALGALVRPRDLGAWPGRHELGLSEEPRPSSVAEGGVSELYQMEVTLVRTTVWSYSQKLQNYS